MLKHQFTSLSLLLSLVFILALPITSHSKSTNQEITADEIISHIRYLASDELEGRGSGTEGNEKAARYIASHFEDAGLKPLGDDGTYFQRFTFVSGIKLGEKNSFVIETGKGKRELKVEEDFLPLSFSSEGAVSGNLVFAGYGISAPDLDYDDYEGISVKDKIAIVLRYTPEGYDSESPFYRYAALRYKAINAREKGAKGIIFVTPTSWEEEEDLGGMRFYSSFTDSGIHAIILRRGIAREILSLAGKEMKNLEQKLAHKRTDSSILPGVKVSLHTDLVREERSTSNVIGFLEGSDPLLKDQIIVVGAHYDHIGVGGGVFSRKGNNDGDRIHNGADDNASGVAGLLELAEYFSRPENSSGRSLVFMAFSGEELGLLGSSYYIKNPEIPLEKIVAMVNMDMIGRLRKSTVNVIGVGTSPAWESLLESANSNIDLSLKTRDSGFAASDQTVFFTKNIPVLLFFTGVHSDYHTPGDGWEKINPAGEEKVVRLIAGVIRKLNRLPETIAFSKPEVDDGADRMGVASFDVYLGTVPDYSEEVDGVKLMGVQSGSPAEKAGLKENDIIVGFSGKTVKNIYDYVYALGEAKPDVSTEMVVIRDGKRISLSVVPESRKNYIH